MLRHLATVPLLALCACQHVQAEREWLTTFYTVNGSEVLVWPTPFAAQCVLGTGPRRVVGGLRGLAITGRAQLLVERLPAPKPIPQIGGVLMSDQYVLIRGVRVQPQCHSKDLYWVSDFRFLGAYQWNDNTVLVPLTP